MFPWLVSVVTGSVPGDVTGSVVPSVLDNSRTSDTLLRLSKCLLGSLYLKIVYHYNKVNVVKVNLAWIRHK